jgi:hypothetical protein
MCEKGCKPDKCCCNEKRVSVNGPRGPIGPRGLTGPAGPEGPAGPGSGVSGGGRSEFVSYDIPDDDYGIITGATITGLAPGTYLFFFGGYQSFVNEVGVLRWSNVVVSFFKDAIAQGTAIRFRAPDLGSASTGTWATPVNEKITITDPSEVITVRAKNVTGQPPVQQIAYSLHYIKLDIVI